SEIRTITGLGTVVMQFCMLCEGSAWGPHYSEPTPRVTGRISLPDLAENWLARMLGRPIPFLAIASAMPRPVPSRRPDAALSAPPRQSRKCHPRVILYFRPHPSRSPDARKAWPPPRLSADLHIGTEVQGHGGLPKVPPFSKHIRRTEPAAQAQDARPAAASPAPLVLARRAKPSLAEYAIC